MSFDSGSNYQYPKDNKKMTDPTPNEQEKINAAAEAYANGYIYPRGKEDMSEREKRIEHFKAGAARQKNYNADTGQVKIPLF